MVLRVDWVGEPSCRVPRCNPFVPVRRVGSYVTRLPQVPPFDVSTRFRIHPCGSDRLARQVVQIHASIVHTYIIHVQQGYQKKGRKKSGLQSNVLLDIRHKLERHALLAPVHLALFRRPKRDRAFMNCDELTFKTGEFGQGKVARWEGDAGREWRRWRGCGDVKREGAPG